jgi:hypothetical protein
VRRKGRDTLFVLVIAILVVAIDMAAMPILREYLYGRAPTVMVLAGDFSIALLAGLAGLYFASRVGSPCWWRLGIGSPARRQATLVTLLLGLVVVVSNTVIMVTYYRQDTAQFAQIAPWAALLTPARASALAFRAALTENVFYRLLLFPLGAWAVGRFTRSRRAALVSGALLSALVCGLLHPGFGAGFLIGVALVYICHQGGLVPVMIVHFLTDVIPLTVVSVAL